MMTPHLWLLYLLNTAAGLAVIAGVALLAWLAYSFIVGLARQAPAPGVPPAAKDDGGRWKEEDWPVIVGGKDGKRQ